MTPRARTMVFIVLVIVLIFAYDAYTIISHGVETSVSQVLIDWGYEYPITSFLAGVVAGHLWWKISKPKQEEKPK